jgi:hypothetical protein
VKLESNRFKKARQHKGSEKRREGATLAYTLFHEKEAPSAIIPLMVDRSSMIVEESSERNEFRKRRVGDVEEFRAGDTVELVC